MSFGSVKTMYSRFLLLVIVLAACGDGVIVKLPPMPQDRGVLELNCVSTGALIAHKNKDIAVCRQKGRNEYILPIGQYLLKIYAAGSYTQYVKIDIKSMQATKLRIELLKAPP